MGGVATYEAWFDTEENKALLAICARHLIRNVGIGGIVWGSINLLIGLLAALGDMIYLAVPVLGLIMLIAGIAALNRPTVKALLVETVVCVMLFGWNAFINYWEFR
jgi:hypothetical protein